MEEELYGSEASENPQEGELEEPEIMKEQSAPRKKSTKAKTQAKPKPKAKGKPKATPKRKETTKKKVTAKKESTKNETLKKGAAKKGAAKKPTKKTRTKRNREEKFSPENLEDISFEEIATATAVCMSPLAATGPTESVESSEAIEAIEAIEALEASKEAIEGKATESQVNPSIKTEPTEAKEDSLDTQLQYLITLNQTLLSQSSTFFTSRYFRFLASILLDFVNFSFRHRLGKEFRWRHLKGPLVEASYVDSGSPKQVFQYPGVHSPPRHSPKAS
jgi:hypothetical protein